MATLMRNYDIFAISKKNGQNHGCVLCIIITYKVVLSRLIHKSRTNTLKKKHV